MSPYLLGSVLILPSYLFGAIPFAYLIVRAVKGVDIRTVGSGNVGATNAGRVLGFRYFLLIFTLDVVKGALPTYLIPKLAPTLPALPVLVALAAILGHNFPIYLKFKGGKGVATSLGALAVLDPIASGSTVVAFILFLLVTRFVSMSSVLAGLVFVLVHFLRVERPWGREEVAMSVVTIGLLAMLTVRHRANFVRIASGTEPKVSFRKGRPPSGCIRWAFMFTIVLTVVSALVVLRLSSRRSEVDLGPIRLVEVARASTGHQRAERVAFADGGRLLAVTCPRYNRVVLYRVGEDEALGLLRDVALDGRPVAVAASRDRLFVLQRPAGDARHIEEGYWQTLDFAGRQLGPKVRVGFDPDDIVLLDDDRHALVLTSGHAEGEHNRPAPNLALYELGSTPPPLIGQVVFDQTGDEPERITLSTEGTHAAISLNQSNQIVGISLLDFPRMEVTGRIPMTRDDGPRLSVTESDSIVMPAASGRETIEVGLDTPESWLVSTLADDSALEVTPATSRLPLGRLTLRGPGNLGTIRPTGMAFEPNRKLIAVANRSGGVHLVAVRPNEEAQRIASTEAGSSRR